MVVRRVEPGLEQQGWREIRVGLEQMLKQGWSRVGVWWEQQGRSEVSGGRDGEE